MPSYNLYVTIDWRGDCTRGKAVYTAHGEQITIHAVEDPEYLSPASVCDELLLVVKEHSRVVKQERSELRSINIDDVG